MKKKLLAVLLLAALLLAALPCGAAAAPFFVAVNDTIPLTLSSNVAPYAEGGLLMLPHTAFGVKNLGITPSYNAAGGTLALFSRTQRLVFDFAADTVTDEDGNVSPIVLTVRDGVVYLPAVMCASHFGVTVSYLTSQSGYKIIRFTNGSQMYDHDLFVQKAETLISYRVQQYLDEQNKAGDPAAPEAPKPSTSEPANPDEKAPRVFLAVENAANMENALLVLTAQRVPAVFFLTHDEIRENPELVIAIASAGFPIGLTAGKTEDASAALEQANAALDALLQQKTLLALLTAEQAGALSGYCVTERSRAVSAAAAAKRTDRNSLVLCSGSCRRIVTQLTAAGADFRQLRETSSF